ncbi:MAG: HAD hydrolase-like protein [Ignavibacteriaceae bacterium]|nr:HAD hydrolase-like protein [Ignavibacteriaceae bacterium]
MKKIGNSKEEVLLIGDTVHDFEVAQEIGADCLLIADGHQSHKKLSACGVPVLDNINKLYDFL